VVRRRADIGVNRRYFLLGIAERRVFLNMSQLLLSNADLVFGTIFLLFWFLMFILLWCWLVGGFGKGGYLDDYFWLRRRNVKRCLVCSREQGLELRRERGIVLLCCVAEK
jgi:hypothetical protein